jgi:hypothetical protein
MVIITAKPKMIPSVHPNIISKSWEFAVTIVTVPEAIMMLESDTIDFKETNTLTGTVHFIRRWFPFSILHAC